MTKKDWEELKEQIEKEKKSLVMSMSINDAALAMIDEKIGAFPHAEAKEKKTKSVPSDYVG